MAINQSIFLIFLLCAKHLAGYCGSENSRKISVLTEIKF